jgi:hypothetical protein
MPRELTKAMLGPEDAEERRRAAVGTPTGKPTRRSGSRCRGPTGRTPAIAWSRSATR